MPIHVIFLTMNKVHWGKVYNPKKMTEENNNLSRFIHDTCNDKSFSGIILDNAELESWHVQFFIFTGAF